MFWPVQVSWIHLWDGLLRVRWFQQYRLTKPVVKERGKPIITWHWSLSFYSYACTEKTLTSKGMCVPRNLLASTTSPHQHNWKQRHPQSLEQCQSLCGAQAEMPNQLSSELRTVLALMCSTQDKNTAGTEGVSGEHGLCAVHADKMQIKIAHWQGMWQGMSLFHMLLLRQKFKVHKVSDLKVWSVLPHTEQLSSEEASRERVSQGVGLCPIRQHAASSAWTLISHITARTESSRQFKSSSQCHRRAVNPHPHFLPGNKSA